jgi:type IV pilus assembly protein PilE
MISVTVVAIIAAVAIPSYNDYVTRGRIVEATSALSDTLIRAEQFFQDNRTYPNGCTTTAPSAIQIRVAALQNFTISCAGGPTTFSATATGSTGKPMAGFVYTINQNGARATTGVKPGWTANNTCWVRKKDGSC